MSSTSRIYETGFGLIRLKSNKGVLSCRVPRPPTQIISAFIPTIVHFREIEHLPARYVNIIFKLRSAFAGCDFISTQRELLKSYDETWDVKSALADSLNDIRSSKLIAIN